VRLSAGPVGTSANGGGHVSYHGHWSAEFSGTNSFVTDFRYEG